MTPADKLRQLAQLFSDSGLESPLKEAEALLQGLLSITKTEIHTSSALIPKESSEAIDAAAQRRIAGEPMHYITGSVEFFGLHISVGKGVLIPRPETELMAEEALRQLEDLSLLKQLHILDLCTGTGCIALSLAKNIPLATVIGIDLSDTALAYAMRNAGQNTITNARFIKGDLFSPLADERFDLIISNPPYIRSEDIASLQREIREHEPMEALDGGADGLAFYRRIIGESPAYLRQGGLLMLELGMGQAGDINMLAQAAGFKDIAFINDYAGIERIFVGKKY